MASTRVTRARSRAGIAASQDMGAAGLADNMAREVEDEVEPGEGDTSVIDINDTLDEVLIEEMEGEEEAEVPATPRANNMHEIIALLATPQHARATMATPEAPHHRAIENALDETIDLPSTPQPTRATVAPHMEETIDLTDSPVAGPSLLASPPPTTLISLSCPICLDSLAAVTKRGGRVLSTLCGHVFCGRCLPKCLSATGACPTCRTRLGGLHAYHSLFLG